MSGLPEVDPDDWQANTEYSGDDYSEDHPVIKVTLLLGYSRIAGLFCKTNDLLSAEIFAIFEYQDD